MKKLLFAAILLAGCNSEIGDRPHDSYYSSCSEVINSVAYHKDVRTNLCYAVSDLGSQNAVMAHVPCTPEVEGLIVKDR